MQYSDGLLSTPWCSLPDDRHNARSRAGRAPDDWLAVSARNTRSRTRPLTMRRGPIGTSRVARGRRRVDPGLERNSDCGAIPGARAASSDYCRLVDIGPPPPDRGRRLPSERSTELSGQERRPRSGVRGWVPRSNATSGRALLVMKATQRLDALFPHKRVVTEAARHVVVDVDRLGGPAQLPPTRRPC